MRTVFFRHLVCKCKVIGWFSLLSAICVPGCLVNLISASQAYVMWTALRVLTFSLCSHSALTFLQDVRAPHFGITEPSIKKNVWRNYRLTYNDVRPESRCLFMFQHTAHIQQLLICEKVQIIQGQTNVWCLSYVIPVSLYWAYSSSEPCNYLVLNWHFYSEMLFYLFNWLNLSLDSRNGEQHTLSLDRDAVHPLNESPSSSWPLIIEAP